MRIGIAFDLAPDDRVGDGPDDRFEEFDKPETVAAIADAIRGAGHDVVLMGDGREFLVRALDDPPDFVFNIAEGEGTSRNREARVPAACEMLGIPYSGSDPLTLAAALDKDAANTLVAAAGLNVPSWVTLPADCSDDRAVLEICRRFESLGSWPDDRSFIIKPAFEGSSKGIRGRCVAPTTLVAATRAARLAGDYQQPVLVQEYIAGDELTVGILGNRAGGEVLGVMRIAPRSPDRDFVYSLEVKRDWANRVDYEAPARLPVRVDRRIRDDALRVYRVLQCRDVARIDFRVRDGVPYFLEANPLPGLNPTTSDLVILARGHGIEYDELIRRILDAALRRVGLAGRGAKAS